jgi:apolipoprotein N-acyltransferase
MAIGLMDTKHATNPSAGDPSVKEIIAAARARQLPVVSRPGSAGAWLLSGMTAVLLWASFTPVDAGPFAWIALVPLLLLIRIPQPTRWMYRVLFATALANQIATLQWMRLGDPTMYIALAALATYCALYIPAFVALARGAHHRWSVPLAVAVPVLWTGLEYARAHLMTGFAWYFLGHSQYRWLELIQISDVVGAYGVSFIVAMANASLAGLIPSRWLLRLRLLTPEDAILQTAVPFRHALLSVLSTVVILAAVLGYGVARRQQADFQPGPRVALIQGNFVASLREPPHDPQKVLLTHLRLTGLAVREQPDIVVWPEAMYPYILLEADPSLTDDQLRAMTPGANTSPDIWHEGIVKRELARESQRAGAALLWGIHAARAEPTGVKQLNSAVFVTPDQGVVGRYDKRHLVPFGEYIPLKSVLPWLQGMTPYRGDVGLAAGTQPMAFDYKQWRFSPVICFEDTVPHVVRSAVAAGSTGDAERPVDVLVNVTNDGWFHGSSELDQHLITAAFRAVECRTPMIRAVNTGISAVIDGDGAILEPEKFIDGDWRKDASNPPRTSMRDPKTGKWHRQLTAALVHTVPLDGRRSLYVRFGDWFAGTCATCVAATAIFAMRRRSARVNAQR